MAILTVEAPAKVNLHLRVGKVRSDGFHGLESIFLALSFGDTLRFEQTDPAGRVEITVRPAAAIPVPIEKNLIFRAITLFRAATGLSQGLRVRVNKRIPLGAGLGGGSSDAAATLAALNTLAAGHFSGQPPLDKSALAALGAELGSDVPFFLNLDTSGAAWVSGRGEKISPLATPAGLWFVLALPDFASETAAAYRLLDEFRAREQTSGAGESGAAGKRAAVSKNALIGALPGEPRKWPFANDFLPVFLQTAGVKTAYRQIIERLKEAGAEFAGLSGSGSACFGVFSDKKNALRAKNTIETLCKFTKVTFPLANGTIPVLQ